MSERDVSQDGDGADGDADGGADAGGAETEETAQDAPADADEATDSTDEVEQAANDGTVEEFDLGPGEQVLVSLPGQKFDYGRLPEGAFANLLVLSVGRNPKQIGRALERLGAPQQSVGVVPVTGSSISYDGPLWTSNRVSPMDLTGISIEFTRGFEHLQSGTGWVLVDSISILSMYADVDRVYRLLDSIVNACRQKNVRGLYVVDGEAMAPETMDRLRGLFDRTVSL